MKIRHKIILLALVPLVLAMLAIAMSVRQQATALSQQQYHALEQTYLASKEAELSHYVQLARTAIEPLYAERGNIPDAQARALATLARMDFGQDGYFFVYDLHGRSLMHPRQPDLVGRDLWDLRDPEGAPTIQHLAEKARAGGGAVRYLWQKPSLDRHVPKLGYVVPLPDWDWMLGSGIYLDDVDAALQRHDQQAKTYIEDTLVLIALIAVVCLLAVVGCGLALNLSEHKTSDAKLRRLAQQVVLSQETERARIARELHDGISQWLVSVKLLLESAIARLGTSTGPVPETLARAHGRLNGALGEIRRISHGLRPTMLDDLGLPAALSELAREAGDLTGVVVSVDISGVPVALNDTAKTVLFRIAQEALTNVERHAAAQEVQLGLSYSRSGVELWVADDGVGFDAAQVHQDPHRGLGLRNMRERLDSVGGELLVTSADGETRISASIPRQHAIVEDGSAAADGMTPLKPAAVARS
jgi:two-component system NarL family sensor kinase